MQNQGMWNSHSSFKEKGSVGGINYLANDQDTVIGEKIVI